MKALKFCRKNVFTKFEEGYLLQRNIKNCSSKTGNIVVPEQISNSEQVKRDGNLNFLISTAIAGFTTGALFWKYASSKELISNPLPVLCASSQCKKFGEVIPCLPHYSAKTVAEHNTKEKCIWVTYKAGVYDITKYICEHPGDKIKFAAGGALEPFWELYEFHKCNEIMEQLEKYRIGNLCIEDRRFSKELYGNEPNRHPCLKVACNQPFSAETPTELLAEKFVTPNALFYVRNHFPVPRINGRDYKLSVQLMNGKTTCYSLKDLMCKFPKHTITATLQNAGNRRSEFNKVKEVSGLKWCSGAIGTATWSGARLVDVLKCAGVDMNDASVKHVHFEGLDKDCKTNTNYSISIPAHKALDPSGDVIIAYEMNGCPLLPDHGFPVRVVVPGYVGTRSVKWLGKITMATEESKSQWQLTDYKSFSPNIDASNVDWCKSIAIQETPVVSAICEPVDHSKVKVCDDKVKVKGYACSGGGRKIIRVDVSADEGKTWKTATLKQDDAPSHRAWAWTLWEVEVPVKKKNCSIGIICKAVDTSYNVQPETFPPIWNLRGFLGTAWHRITVNLQ
ncbi:sulfite oxidase-like [Centruroides vittatus]|uniref:sulfite oxidase-like n=1 Tax=Centruroides vittatus TaxID=120091 RepID=UPI00350F2D61